MNTPAAAPRASLFRRAGRSVKKGAAKVFQGIIGVRVSRSVCGNIFNMVFLTLLAELCWFPCCMW